MNIDIEFFSDNPMDNILTCTKFQFQKVIFLGYTEEDMDKVAKSTVSAFLKSANIGVQYIEFVAVPEGNLKGIKAKLSDIIAKEKLLGNQCFLDLTGGEELILAAAGIVSAEHDIPIHEIDLVDDVVRIQAFPDKYNDLKQRNYYLNIEEYLNLHEGVIEQRMLKNKNRNYKSISCKNRIIELSRYTSGLGKKWNKISQGLAKLCSKQGEFIMCDKTNISDAAKVARLSITAFVEQIKDMYKNGILKSCIYEKDLLSIEFFNTQDRELLCDPGAILEHLTYWQVIKDKDINDCIIGCHINWVGDGNPDSIYEPGPDVLNEVDVIYMKKNIPVFISCKNTMVTDNHPLYELETVADRFGGSQVKKVLVAKAGVSPGISQRAKEMEIIIKRHF